MMFPSRKSIRLAGYDYSSAGYYFVTICTKDRQCLLRRGAHCAPASVALSEIGQKVEECIRNISTHYANAMVDKYVIMPNHIHMILILDVRSGRTMCAPTAAIPKIVRAMKAAVTKEVGYPIWQKGYYDHVIRNQADYLRIWEYIDTNPAKWTQDKYYNAQES